jgi:hypothetical protein
MNKKLMILELKKMAFKMKGQIKREIDENDRVSSLIFLTIIETHLEALEAIIRDDTAMTLKDEERLLADVENFVKYHIRIDIHDKRNTKQ